MFTMLELPVLFVLFNYHDVYIELANDIALKLPDAETLLFIGVVLLWLNYHDDGITLTTVMLL